MAPTAGMIRYNTDTKKFERSTNEGSSWADLEIDAGQITTGTLNIARFPTGGNWAITSDLAIDGAQVGIGGTPGTDLHIKSQSGSVELQIEATLAATHPILSLITVDTTHGAYIRYGKSDATGGSLRVLSLKSGAGIWYFTANGNLAFNAEEAGTNAKGVICLTDAIGVPTSNVGGQLYADSGTLKYRGPSGTVTNLAPP